MENVIVKLKLNGQLYLVKDEREIEVDIKECFPRIAPGRFLSLRDSKNREVLMVPTLKDLSDESSSAIKKYLAKSQFAMEIIDLISIEEDVELRIFTVNTKQGVRSFQTKLEDWPSVQNDGTVLFEDVAGDTFKVRSPADLDKKGQKLLSDFIM